MLDTLEDGLLGRPASVQPDMPSVAKQEMAGSNVDRKDDVLCFRNPDKAVVVDRLHVADAPDRQNCTLLSNRWRRWLGPRLLPMRKGRDRPCQIPCDAL